MNCIPCESLPLDASLVLLVLTYFLPVQLLLIIPSNEVHGYKEILFPIDSGLRQDGLHIWPRNSHMLMALANLDGSMTGTLYMNTSAGRY